MDEPSHAYFGDTSPKTVTPSKRVAIGGEEVFNYTEDTKKEVRLAARNAAKTGGAGAPRKKRGPPTPVQDEIQDDTETVKVPAGRAKKTAKHTARTASKPANADSPPGSPEAGEAGPSPKPPAPKPASPEAGPAPKPPAPKLLSSSTGH